MNTNVLLGALAVGAIGVVVVVTQLGKEEEGVQSEPAPQTEVATEVTLPADFPTTVPLYPGVVIKNVQEVMQDTTRNITLTLETPDGVADINTWYRGALSENAWAVTSDRNVGGYTLLKGEQENVAVFMQAAARSDLGVSVITQRVQMK